MSPPLVVVGGPPGSGKTTAARAVAERLGLKYRSAGDRFRALARERGMTLEELSRYAEQHPEVDRALDDDMAGFARSGWLLDSRMAGPLARRKGIPVLYLVVTARVPVRARRLAGRDGVPVPVARERMLAREKSEKDRYKALYGIDLDREVPDLKVDSSDRTPAEVVDRLVDFIRRHATPTSS